MRNTARGARRCAPPVALALLIGAMACADSPTAPLVPKVEPPGKAPRVVGAMLVRFSAVGPGQISANATMYKPEDLFGPRFALTTTSGTSPSGNVAGVIGVFMDGGGSFTYGTPGAGGYRYLFATMRVRNAGVATNGDTVAYSTARPNLTLVATAAPSGFTGAIPGTAFASPTKFDGSAANPAIAAGITPTGAVRQTLTGGITTHSPDVLQVFTEGEVAVLTGYDAFPFGYVVTHATATNTRTLAANPGPNQFDGFITFGIKIPLQTNPADDVFGFSMFFVVVDDSEVRVTQSIEEQDAAGQAAFEARVAALGGVTGITLLPGGSYGGSVAAPVRKLCAVRVAGTVTSPTTFLDGSSASSCPTLTSVSPGSGLQGATVNATLTGTNFVTGNTTVTVSGTGVTVSNVTVNSATSLTADFTIASGATTGARTVHVTTPTGNSGTRTFNVNSALAPTLSNITPNSASQGQFVHVVLTGTNFVSGATVSVSGGLVDVMNVTVVNGTTIEADFGVQPTAAKTARSVTVTTSNGTSGPVTFTVN